MVTDPVRRIHEREPETPLTLSLKRILRPLAELPPSLDAPYFTVSLDWRPEGGHPARRAALDQFAKETEALLERYGPRGTAFDSLKADIARVQDYLDNELDPSAQGVVILANHALDLFKPIAFGLPVPTRIQTGPIPALSTIIRLIDDYPTYAVLVADQHEATLTLITRASRGASVWLESDPYPRKQQQGGWSQRRYQARADERVSHFAQAIAEETRQVLDEAEVKMLVLASRGEMTSELERAFHETVRQRIIGQIAYGPREPEHQLIDKTLPLVERAEREREEAGLRQLRDLLGAHGAATAGPDDVLTALQAGQVMTLFMNDDFQSPGWADYTMPLVGAGDVPVEHPAGGDPTRLVAIPLEEEIVRLVVRSGAEIDIIPTVPAVSEEDLEDIPDADEPRPRTEPARQLDEYGGIAAILRYSLDADQPSAEV